MNTAPPWLDPRTAYVHIPFCGHRCGYCDFAVTAGQDHLIELYLDALGVELRSLGTPRPVESLFVGGGTPTYLTADQLDRLFTTLDTWFPRPAGAEVSVESTPESLTAEKARVLAAHGVNRVSVGVQSFQPGTLAALDRRHGVEHIGRALDAVRPHVPAVSLDLIFGAPGQTLADWQRDLAAAVALDPDHLSTYGLTYETGTRLFRDRANGKVTPVPEDAELAMYEHAMDSLPAAGFEQYEISNFARPGQRSRHNQRYWANEAYYGFGVGAAWYVGGERGLNTRATADYVRKVLAGDSPAASRERLAPRDRAFETIGTQLRRVSGIGRTRFREQTGFAIDELVGEPITALVGEGLLADEGQAVSLTRRGRCVADGVIEALMAANVPEAHP